MTLQERLLCQSCLGKNENVMSNCPRRHYCPMLVYSATLENNTQSKRKALLRNNRSKRKMLSFLLEVLTGESE